MSLSLGGSAAEFLDDESDPILSNPSESDSEEIKKRSVAYKLDAFEKALHVAGTGKYQVLLTISLGIAVMVDGSEGTTNSLINYVFGKFEFNIPISQLQLLGSILFLGMLLGNILVGLLDNKMGRKPILVIVLMITLIFAFLSSIAKSFPFFLATRALHCFGVGSIMSLAVTFVVESFEKDVRGKYWVGLNIFWIIGQFLSTMIAEQTQSDKSYTQGWRYMTGWQGLASVFCLIMVLIFVKETPRYSLMKEGYEKCVKVLTEIKEINHSSREVERSQLPRLQEYARQHSQKNVHTLTEFFENNDGFIITLLFIVWFMTLFVYYGLVYVLPLSISKINAAKFDRDFLSYNHIYVSTFAEVPATFLMMMIVDKKGFGRKNTLMYSLTFLCLACFGIYFFDNLLLLFLFVARFCAVIAYFTLYLITSEKVATPSRVTAMVCCVGVGKLGAVLMPVLSLEFLKISGTLPYMLFAIASAVAASSALLLPETRQRNLDTEARRR